VSLEERSDGLQTHPETDDCEVRFTDEWGVAVAPPQAPTPETAAPDEIDLKVYPTVDEVLIEIFTKANLPRLGGQSTGRGWSSISTYQRCPHLFKRKYVEQRQPGLFVESPSLAIGTLIHVFLATHYTRMIEPEYLLAPEVVHDAVKMYANPEFVGEAWRVFSAYRVYYSLETIQPLAIEYDLKDPRTGESCRYDLIAYLPEGVAGYRPGTYVYEHKSASRFDSDTLEGWACDGEVIGQAALWKRLGLDLRFGKLQGVMINLLGKHKVPQFHRTLVSPDSIQIASHLDDLKRWESLIQLSTASNNFPRARGGCLHRYGRCAYFDECATGEN
jgi:hypothetical protein